MDLNRLKCRKGFVSTHLNMEKKSDPSLVATFVIIVGVSLWCWWWWVGNRSNLQPGGVLADSGLACCRIRKAELVIMKESMQAPGFVTALLGRLLFAGRCWPLLTSLLQGEDTWMKQGICIIGTPTIQYQGAQLPCLFVGQCWKLIFHNG